MEIVSLKGPKSNTGLSKLQSVRAGLDWLQLSFYGRNVPTIERNKLAELRERAVSGEFPEYFVAGVPFQVQPYGFGVGAAHMSYVLKGDGLTIALSKRDKSPEKGGPVCMLTAPGSYCTGKDPVKLFNDLQCIATLLGVTFDRITITRVDVHVDVDGRRVSDVVSMIEDGRVISRAKRFKVEGQLNGEIETFYLGSAKANTKLCVYDKVAELLKDPLKAKNYFERWGLKAWPESCTRYEWRIDSEGLRENHGIRSAADFFKSLRTIVQYLTSDWYRECVVVDRNHTERAQIDGEWKEIRQRAVSYFEGMEPRRTIQKPLPVKEELIKQALGCLAAAAASLGVLPEDGFNAAEFFQQELMTGADVFRHKVAATISRIRATWGDIFRREDERKRQLVLAGL